MHNQSLRQHDKYVNMFYRLKEELLEKEHSQAVRDIKSNHETKEEFFKVYAEI